MCDVFVCPDIFSHTNKKNAHIHTHKKNTTKTKNQK